MTERNSQAFSAHRKGLAAASVFMLGLTAAAAAFAVGYTGALTEGLAGPASGPHMRLLALERLDTSLGYGGFLKFYGAFLATGDRTPETELRRLVDQADASLAEISRASTSEAEIASAVLLRRLEAPFRRTAVLGAREAFAPKDAIPAIELERDYAALKTAIAASAQAADRRRLDILAGALVWMEAFFLGALLLLSMALIVLAWLLSKRPMAPVENLLASAAPARARGMSQPLWGAGREDDIGDIARSAKQHAETGGPNLDLPLPQLHLKIMEQLAQGAARLESEMSKASTATQQACLRIEQAGERAAKAGQAAIEAAALTHDGVRYGSGSAQDRMEAAAARLSRSAAQWELRGESASPSLPELQDDDAAAVLESLAGGLDALERYARERPRIEQASIEEAIIEDDRLVPLAWALFKAVDRLNAVAHSLSGTSDPNAIQAAE